MTKRRIDDKGVEVINPFENPHNNSDLVIVVGNNEEQKNLYAHKTILSFASPVFDRMFKSDFIESKQNQLELTNFSYQAVLNTLKMIYPLQDFNLDNMDEFTISGVLNFSKIYMIDSVSKRIKDYLMLKFLELKNRSYTQSRRAEWILQVADQNDFRDLVNLTAQFMGQNNFSIPASNSDRARTKVYAHRMVKVCKELREKTSILQNTWGRRRDDQKKLSEFVIKIEGTTIDNYITDIERLAKEMSNNNYLYNH